MRDSSVRVWLAEGAGGNTAGGEDPASDTQGTHGKQLRGDTVDLNRVPKVRAPTLGSNRLSQGAETLLTGPGGDRRTQCDQHSNPTLFAQYLVWRGVGVEGGQEELDEYKRLMEEDFRRNAILPGDPRYKHDVQVDRRERVRE